MKGKNIVNKKIHECMHTHGGKNVHKTIYSGLKSKFRKFSATSYEVNPISSEVCYRNCNKSIKEVETSFKKIDLWHRRSAPTVGVFHSSPYNLSTNPRGPAPLLHQKLHPAIHTQCLYNNGKLLGYNHLIHLSMHLSIGFEKTTKILIWCLLRICTIFYQLL